MKKTKRSLFIAVILTLVLMSFFAYLTPAYAAQYHMFDEAGLMTDSELSYVDGYLSDLSAELGFDIVGVLTYKGYGSEELTAFADDFYDYGGFGYGDDKDGVIFVVDMNEKSRRMVLVTTGYGTEAITDYGEEVIYDYVTDSLRTGDFVEAYTKKYADCVADFVEMSREGQAVDVNSPGHDGYEWYEEPENYPSSNENPYYGLKGGELAVKGGLSVLVGAIVGLFSSQRNKSKLKTVRKKYQANSYARRDSLVLTRKQDMFLYSNVTVTHRPKNENRDNGPFSGGGTTIHMGSSGVPHGGGHGRSF